MAAANAIMKPYEISTIKTCVPITLDLDQLNYDAWRELFSTHCISYGLQDHLDATKDKPDIAKWNWINAIGKS